MVTGEVEEEYTWASLSRRYEIGWTLGEGNYSKVKYTGHLAIGSHFAVKILDLNKILSLRIDVQVDTYICFLSIFGRSVSSISPAVSPAALYP